MNRTLSTAIRTSSTRIQQIMRLQPYLVQRHLFLLPGFLVMALGIALMVRANLGLAPWDVLHMGLTKVLPVTFGQASQATGLAIIVISMALRVWPTLATVLNMALIGYFYDVLCAWGLTPPPATNWYQEAAFMLLGTALMGLGSAWYMSPDLGAGPRDALMMALVKRTGLRVAVVRALLEGSALVLGYFLGGRVGLGTVLFALLIGPAVEVGFLFFVPLRRIRWLAPLIPLQIHRPKRRPQCDNGQV